MKTKNAADDSALPSRIEFHFIKSNHFRVVHVDGGIGGLTGRGFCHIALYSERAAIPRMTVQEVNETGDIQPERTVEVLGEPNIGIVREVEVDLMLSEQAVRDLRDWFERRVRDFENMRAESKEDDNDRA